MTAETMDMKQFLVNQVLTSELADYSKETKQALASLRREKVEKPTFYIGMGTCGIIAGATKTLAMLRTYLDDRQIEADIIETGCLGFCSAEPLLDVQLPGRNRISFKFMTEDKVYSVLDGLFNNVIFTEDTLGQYTSRIYEAFDSVPFMDDLPFFALQKKLVSDLSGKISPENIEEYIAHGGYKAYLKTIRYYTSVEICSVMEKSGLKGRGGGGFLTGEKWKLALNTGASQKYLICNADESDPGAYSHRALIESNPHRLIEGICIAAYAIGSSKAFIYVRSSYDKAINLLAKAIAQAHEYGLLGHNVFESGFNLEIVLKRGAGALVCGEETALISSIEGKRGMPRPKPPYPAESGLFGKPTVVNNVETLMNVPVIIANGPDWFSSIGTELTSGTKVLSLSGNIVRNGLVEVTMGTSLKKVIESLGGGVPENKKFKAVQIGGPMGGIVPAENSDIPIDYETLKSMGVMMGSGGLIIMDQDTCMIDMAKFMMDFIQKGSCGKCIPCREGTRRMYEILENVTIRPKTESRHKTLERFKGLMQLESLAKVIKDTSLCGLGQTAANPVLSTMKWFRDEYEEHIYDRKCRAGVCTDLRIFYIDVNKCTGCTLCIRKCPTNAIIGVPKNVHYILDDKCIGCGNCQEVCKFGAVFIK